MSVLPGRISPHFSEREFTRTSHKQYQDTPTHEHRLNAVVLAASVLEPLRARVGPLRINSWWRGERLNDQVGGSPTSHHLMGCAADIVPIAMDRALVWRTLVGMVDSGLGLTEAMVYESKPHIHLSYVWWRPIEAPELMVKLSSDRTVLWSDYDGSLI